MKKNIIFVLLLSLVAPLLFTSCKSEFEKVRASGNSQLMYEKAYDYYKNEEYLKAQTLFELLIGAYRGKKELEDIYYKYADTYYKLDRYVLASYYFKNFATTFSTSEKRQDADFMNAYSNYKMSPVYRLDQTYSDKAIGLFQEYVNTYPESPRVKEANELIDEMRKKLEEKAYHTADLYFDLKQYQAALTSYENVLKDFPETTNAEQVRYKIVKASYEMAVNSIYDKREKRLEQAKEVAQEFLDKYKKSSFRKEVKSLSNNTTKKLKEFKDGRYQEPSSRS